MHDVEGDTGKERKYELRKVGLVGITQSVNTALNQTGIGLIERFCKALERKHLECIETGILLILRQG
jgi:hypothetical protein